MKRSDSPQNNSAMSRMTEPARRARDAALERHRKEVRLWKVSSWVGFGLFVASLALWLVPRSEWSDTEDCPPLQRVTVVTEGFKDKDGKWRSFDNGEPITVKEWKP